MIEIAHVTRRFGSKLAVDGLDLEIAPGTVFAFLGANGAGKTTTIKMLVGLLKPDEGSVKVCGIDTFSHAREAARHVGYVPDQPFLYEKLTGREFLEFVAQMRGFDRESTADRIACESHRFSLGEFIDDLCETYSHGMKQRLVFASALLHDPKVLIVDEPMVGLDPKSMYLVKHLLRQHARDGAAVFMSTHTLHVAEEIADTIGIIDRGRLQFLGTHEQLREQLASDQVSLEKLFLQLTADSAGAGNSS